MFVRKLPNTNTTLDVGVMIFLKYTCSAFSRTSREEAKNMIMYAMIGLFVIWMAPLIVNFIVG